MKKPDLRAELRVAITHRGLLSVPGSWIPCLIQDLSSKGFLILCNKQFPIGEILELKCELYPDKVLQCKIEVRHLTDMCLGTKIIEIDAGGLRLCRQYLDEHYSLNKFA